jgi:UDP-glucuronate decarboxylase
MRILITGGSGFIGRNLCEKLLHKNEVIILDNNISSSKNNIISFEKHKNFTFICDELVNINQLKLGNIDFVYNLACPASPKWYQKFPNETIISCTQGIYELIKFVKKNNAKFFHASTSEVYGDPLVSTQSEEYFGNVNSFGPRSCYDEGKRCAEAIIYSNKDDIDFYIGRIFNTYGPYMAVNDGRVISNFINQAINNEPITIYGNGSQTRSFCYVEDMINLLAILPKTKIDYKKPFNIGNNVETSIGDIAKLIIKLSNSKSTISYLDFPENDPKIRKPDLKRVNEIFNWKAEINLENGIKKTVEYFKKI